MSRRNVRDGVAFCLVASLFGFAPSATPARSQVLGPSRAPVDLTATGDTAPPFPATDTPAVLNRLELEAIGQPSPTKKGIETTARTKDGRPVVLRFDRFGRLKEVEANRAERPRPAARAFASADEIETGVRRAGFEPRGRVEFKKNHATVLASTRDQQPVELHVDRFGTIYKQKWLR